MSMFWWLFVLTVSDDAHACGGFYHEEARQAEAGWLEALFEPGDGFVEVTYEAGLTLDAARFGWVVPIPGPFVSLEDGDADRLGALFHETSARYDLEAESSGGCGAVAAKDGAGNLSDSGGDRGVTVVDAGSTGTYDYTVLEATSTDALLAWLGDHGWPVGETAPALDAYVGDGGWQFVALALSADLDGESVVDTEVTPIRIRYEGDRVVFPMRMNLGSALGLVRTIVYVAGDERARVAGGWGQRDLDLIHEPGEDSETLAYEALDAALADAGASRELALTFAGEIDGRFVSRFETAAAPENHDADAEFAVDAGTEPLHLLISNRTGCDRPEGAAAALLLPGVALLLRRGRRAR